jgi:hypothetical protein
MRWRFGLKIREQFTVSVFSVTVWQTLLHILIIVYWNKSGLIQTDATNDVIVNSFFGVTNNRVYNDVFHTFTFPMQQSVSFTYQHVTTIWQKQIRIILLILDFKIGNGRQSKRLYLTTWGEFFFSFTYFL